MAGVLVLSGPNLNLLGSREPEIYGTETLEQIHHRLGELAAGSGLRLECFQSNAEHELIERIHGAAQQGWEAAILNPGAFTHTSIALRDALLGTGLPFIEVHLSNPYAREPFRRHSYLSDVARGVIYGLGAYGYELALMALQRDLASHSRVAKVQQ